MDFKIVQSAIANIIGAVENSAIAQVKSLKDHVFSSRITNFPKTQDVKGTVVVGNQKNVEIKLKDIGQTLKDLKKAVIEYKAPDSIKVTNFPTPEKFPDFPKEIKVSNFPKQEVVREIEVTNQPVQELENIGEALTEVKKAIKGIKLAPVINVEAPKKETVVVPAPNVVLQEKELDYEKLSKAIASEMPGIDYKKLSEVLVKEMAGMVITSGGKGGSVPTVSASGIRSVPTVGAKSLSSTSSAVEDTDSSTIILNSNSSRLGATILNDSSSTLYLLLGLGDASETNYTVKIIQNGYYEVPFNYAGQISGVWATDPNDGGARITEFS